MTIIVHFLDAWTHYLFRMKFTLLKYNLENTYFKTQKKLTPKEARCMEFIEKYDFIRVHKPGKQNKVVDIFDRVKEGAKEDVTYTRLYKEFKEKMVRKYGLED